VSGLGILCTQLVNVVRGSRRGQVQGSTIYYTKTGSKDVGVY
jgi:hypothetical protein